MRVDEIENSFEVVRKDEKVVWEEVGVFNIGIVVEGKLILVFVFRIFLCFGRFSVEIFDFEFEER